MALSMNCCNLDTHSSAVAKFLKGTHVVISARNEVLTIKIVAHNSD